MLPPENSRPMLVGCGILRREIRLLVEKNGWELDTFFIDSMLHVDFDALAAALTGALKKFAQRRIIVFYGACHPLIDQILKEADVKRVSGQNCVEMLLGSEQFMSELSGGAYFLLEEWAIRWDEMIGRTFGANPEIIRHIFQEDRTNLLCIQTPCSSDFSGFAAAAGELTGLPVRTVNVSLDNLERCLQEAIEWTERRIP